MICQVSLFSRFLLLLSIPQAKPSNIVITRLFFRPGKDQKSPSVVPVDFTEVEVPEDGLESESIATDSDNVTEASDDPAESPQESLGLVDSVDLTEVGGTEVEWDQIAQEASLDQESLDDLTVDRESISATQKVLDSDEESADAVVIGADGADGADGANGVDAVVTTEPVAEDISNVEDGEEVAIAEDQVPNNLDDLTDETLDTSEDQDVGETGDEAIDPIADVADDIEEIDETGDGEPEQEELEVLGDSSDTEPNLLSQVESGFYTVDATGKVEFTFIFDSGAYEGQLAAISMTGMENLDLNSPEFFRESLQRALSGSEAKLGYIVIDDISAGAMFSGELEPGFDYNHGEFAGTSIVEFQAGDKFFLMLIPNGSVGEVEEALEAGTTKDVRPLFSLVAANPTKAIQMGQIVDVTGDGNTYVFEDIRQDGASDKDFNDLIFQVKGATITTVTLDDLILEGEMSPEADWRNTEIGQQIVDYAASQVVLAPEPNPVEKYEFPKEDQPLLGFIDTHFTQGNPDIDYSRIIFGKDYIENDSDPTVVAVVGEGTHGDHILGIVAATQDNGLGIDGLNDDAPLWVSSAVESGKWADALVEFVDAAKASNQPNAIINLSIDLTQVNPDGTVTTRYEFTPQERGAIEYARQSGVLIVAAAGNDGGVMSVLGQASQEFDNIITVGSSDGFTRAEYSSYGQGLDIVAPGGTTENPVLSTTGESVGSMVGTSVATAKVTGAASQVWAANPELSYRQVIEILKETATDLDTPGWDAETGTGLLNMAAAVGLARVTVPEPKLSQTPAINLPDLKTPVLGTTQADDGIIYLSTSSGQILRIDTQTGEQRQVYQGRTFTDIAVASSGKLYGSTFNSLFAIDPVTGKETLIGQFGSGLSINALTFSPDGRLYGADSNTGKLFLISPQTAQTVEMGSLGGASSGDIIFNGRSQILATVKGATTDRLVAVDTTTGNSEVLGDLGFRDVYGLALLNGVLTGFTANGQKLQIDPQTGKATVVGTVSSKGQILGAADNPSSAGIAVGALPQVLPEGDVDPSRLPIPIERATDFLSQLKASAMGSDWRIEYDRTQNWIGNITSLWPQYWWKDGQGRFWDIVYTTNGFMIRTPGLGAFAFSWDEYRNTKSWDLFWNSVSAGLSRNQILAIKDAYWSQRQWSTEIVGSLRWRSSSEGRGWVQEFNGSGGRRLLMLENGANQAYWVLGDNYREYMELGGPEGKWLDGRFVSLGFPRSNENRIGRQDGRYATWQAFSSGGGKSRIHHLGRSVATWGSIGSVYTDMGGASNWLGMPTRREYMDGDTIFSDFEGGRIACNRSNGLVEAIPWGKEPSWRSVIFDIKPSFHSNLRQSAQNVINDAINTWESIIKSGPKDSPLKDGFQVRIYESNGAGYAGGSYDLREIDLTPAFFKLPYDQQKKVLMHELCHVMGFGYNTSPQYWSNIQMIGGAYYFTGANATSEYGGNIPLMSNFNSKEKGYFHLQENNNKLRYDLMSAETNEGYSQIDLKYTIAALKDMGFQIR